MELGKENGYMTTVEPIRSIEDIKNWKDIFLKTVQGIYCYLQSAQTAV